MVNINIVVYVATLCKNPYSLTEAKIIRVYTMLIDSIDQNTTVHTCSTHSKLQSD